MKYITLVIALAVVFTGCTPQAEASTPTQTVVTMPTNTAQPTSTATTTPTPTHPSACTVSDTGGEVLNVRRAPSKQAEITSSLLPGTTVTVTDGAGDWYQIDNPSGYVSRSYCK